MKQLDEIIAGINPGRKIDMEKLCPHIKEKCIGINCNAYQPYMNINVVDQNEINEYIANGEINWQKNFEKVEWRLHTKFITPSLHEPDKTTMIFVRPVNNSLSLSTGYANCMVGFK